MAEEPDLEGLDKELDEATRYILIALDPTDVLDKLRADSLDQWDEEEE